MMRETRSAFADQAADQWFASRKSTPVLPPHLRLQGLSVRVTKQAGAYQGTVDIAALLPAGTVTYYVDPVNGLDANSGLTRAAPLRYLSTALKKADADEVRIINLTGNFVGRGTGNNADGQAGWNNAQFNRSMSVIVEGPYRYISASSASTSAPVFTATSGRTNVYQSTGIANGVIDCSAYRPVGWAAGASPPANAAQVIANAPKRYRTYTKAASINAVEATPGSWFADATNTYVRPFDDRDLTIAANAAAIVLSTGVNSGRWSPTSNDQTLYVEGMDFVGGSRSFYMYIASTVTGSTVITNGCSFQGSGGSNGCTIQGPIRYIGYRSAAYDNWSDGFNYHSMESDGETLGTSPAVIEIECVAAGNGTTGATATSDNASTAHDDCVGVRIDCVYPDSNDRVVADTNYARTWNVGVIAGQATTQAAGKETFASLLNATMWLDGCVAVRGDGQSNADYFTETADSVLLYRNMDGVVNGPSGLGVIAEY